MTGVSFSKQRSETLGKDKVQQHKSYWKWTNNHCEEFGTATRHSTKNIVTLWRITSSPDSKPTTIATQKDQFCPGGTHCWGETWHAPETLKQHRGSGRNPGGMEKAALASSNNAAAVSCVGFLLVMRCVPAHGQHFESRDTGQVTAIKYTIRSYGGDKTTPEQT